MKVRVNTHGIFGVMNAYIVEKTIVEPPPAVDTAAGESASAAASATSTDTKEQTEKQEETKSMEDDVQKQNGDTKEETPKDEAQTDDAKEEQKTPPDVQMKSESQESDSTGQETESMETEPTNQQQTQSVSEIVKVNTYQNLLCTLFPIQFLFCCSICLMVYQSLCFHMPDLVDLHGFYTHHTHTCTHRTHIRTHNTHLVYNTSVIPQYHI